MFGFNISIAVVIFIFVSAVIKLKLEHIKRFRIFHVLVQIVHLDCRAQLSKVRHCLCLIRQMHCCVNGFLARRLWCSRVLQVLDEGLPEGICLNVNVPEVPAEALKGVKICSQANGFWKEEFEKRKDPTGKDYYWLTGFFHNREPDDGGEGTDEWALAHHYASVVPVNTDLTAHALLKKIGHWETSIIEDGSK